MEFIASVGTFVGAIAPGTWPEWFSAGGTTAAFLIAAAAYARDVSNRRTAQARLVYAEVVETRLYGPGSTVPRVIEASGAPRWAVEKDNRGNPVPRVLEHLVGVTVAVHNLSDELLAEAWVEPVVERVAQGDSQPTRNVPIAHGPVVPRGIGQVQFLFPNPVAPAVPAVHARVTFRDSAGRWWRRYSSEPVERSRPMALPPEVRREVLRLTRADGASA